jgi:hypothetical protein
MLVDERRQDPRAASEVVYCLAHQIAEQDGYNTVAVNNWNVICMHRYKLTYTFTSKPNIFCVAVTALVHVGHHLRTKYLTPTVPYYKAQMR